MDVPAERSRLEKDWLPSGTFCLSSLWSRDR